MNVVKEIQRINEREIERSDYSESASWHAQYKNTAWIFAGNMPFDLTEGDIICIFSQYGEIMNIELIRDKDTGKSKGFAFLQYEDQRSTVLAVDNLNGSNVLSRTLRVDHSYGPKPRRIKQEDGSYIEEPYVPSQNAAPKMIEVSASEARAATAAEAENNDYDAEDPMAAYFRDKARKKNGKKDKKKKKKKEKRHRSSRHSDAEEEDRQHSVSPSRSPSRHDRRDDSEEDRRRRRPSRSPSRRYRHDDSEDDRRCRSPSRSRSRSRSPSEEDRYRRRRSPSPRRRDRRSDSEEDYRRRRRRSPSPSRRDRYDDDDRRRRRRRDY